MARARPRADNGDLASAVGALRREFATRYLVTVRLDWPQEAYPPSPRTPSVIRQPAP